MDIKEIGCEYVGYINYDLRTLTRGTWNLTSPEHQTSTWPALIAASAYLLTLILLSPHALPPSSFPVSTYIHRLLLVVKSSSMFISKGKFPVYFLFPTADLIDNTQRYYEIYSVLLQICTVATAVKTMWKYCYRGFGCNLNPRSHCFNCMSKLWFVNLSVVATVYYGRSNLFEVGDFWCRQFLLPSCLLPRQNKPRTEFRFLSQQLWIRGWWRCAAPILCDGVQFVSDATLAISFSARALDPLFMLVLEESLKLNFWNSQQLLCCHIVTSLA
jgi:hypothetical protein